MKKILFASAFALMGIFAMANETAQTGEKIEEKAVHIICIPVDLSCTEDCYMMDTELVYTLEQIKAELEFQEDYVCGGGQN